MAKYVPDVNTKRWMVLSQVRTNRPSDSSSTKPFDFAQGKPFDKASFGKAQDKPFDSAQGRPECPFCEGNEHLTPPEVYRVGTGEKDKPGWLVRVVPNLFPITDVHEVIIHSPHDRHDINELSIDHVTKLFTVYRDRYRAHENDGHVLIFCNHGLHAGASLLHPHSQLVVVPKQINLDALTLEPIANVVIDNTYFVTYCPDFSQWPYEVWIAPKERGTKFGDSRDNELSDLASLVQQTLRRLEAVFAASWKRAGQRDMFVYNYYIYHGDNWFLRIIPRFIHRAGFELGTGLNVNIVDPSEASQRLRASGEK